MCPRHPATFQESQAAQFASLHPVTLQMWRKQGRGLQDCVKGLRTSKTYRKSSFLSRALKSHPNPKAYVKGRPPEG